MKLTIVYFSTCGFNSLITLEYLPDIARKFKNKLAEYETNLNLPA